MIRSTINRLVSLLAASLVATLLVAIPLGWETGTSGSALLTVDTCAAGTCVPMADWICFCNGGISYDKCCEDDCGN